MMQGEAERRSRAASRFLLGGALLAGLLGPSAAATAAPRRPSELARPDGALYSEARQALAALRSSPALRSKRSEWEKVVQKHRKLVARYPQSGYADDALLAIGDLHREMARSFKTPRDKDEAERAYRRLAAEYPRSRLGEPALYAALEIARESGSRKRVVDAANAYLETYPDGARAREVKSAARSLAAQPDPPLPTPPPPGLAQVYNLRFWTGQSSTRVVLDVEKVVPFKYDRLANPDRLWVDLSGTRLHPSLKDRAFPVGDGLLEQVRIAQNRDNVVRVVLDFKEARDPSVFYLQDPVRLVVDVGGSPRPETPGARPAAPPAGPPRDAPAAVASSSSPPPPAAAPAPPAASEPGPRAGDDPAVQDLPASARRVADLLAPRPDSSPLAVRHRGPQIVIEGQPGPEPRSPAAQKPAPPAPVAPQANRAGSYSLARQLGLGARRIVIDAGHGGHDPGTIGRGGLQEKDLVLDVALKVAKLVKDELGAEVVLTRSTDVFVPLEERTAIANARGADLFLSIHANASRNAGARGIETYFLNFARDPHAEAVAARENAISPATLKDLQNLVKAIALNSKIDESRDFAASVQEAMIGSLKAHYPAVLDRGVHSAPFYVLIGANMPSILTEIAFLSHPQEERLLRSSDYRARIAASVAGGVKAYLEGLNATVSRQLTAGGRRTRVAERAGEP